MRLNRSVPAGPLIVLLALLPCVNASAESVSSVWTCRSGALEREITLARNEPLAPAPAGESQEAFACRVDYSKNGAVEVLWRARHDPEFCEPRVLALLSKLRAAGFQCEESGHESSGDERRATGTIDANGNSRQSPASPAPRNDPGDDPLLRALLERHYEDFYLDAMIGAIPAGFTVASTSDAVATESGDILFVGPPNHFVKAMPDGSYVLVNTLVAQRDSMSSFVNLGFVVRNNRYRFLGYAIAHAAVEAKVSDADADQVSLMVTTAATASCESVRRVRTLRWGPDFVSQSSQRSEATRAGSASASDCPD